MGRSLRTCIIDIGGDPGGSVIATGLPIRRGLARVFIKYHGSDKSVIYTLVGTGYAL